MIQLAALVVIMMIFFGIVGALRGFNREVIALAGIILGLFALFQFDSLLRSLLVGLPADQFFLIQALVFIAIVFFAYQTRALGGGGNRTRVQNGTLGFIIGVLNGYLIWGSLWYFMDINAYPLSPLIIAPGPDTVSAALITYLPLTLLAGGPGGSGDLLAAMVIVLFVVVLIVI